MMAAATATATTEATAATTMNGGAEFDHAVIMARDRLDALAPHFIRQGFHLSDKATHNLGSCNRLIVLDNSYIELLGWPPGKPPARQEIADSPLGLEALVFRTHDAQATHDRLRDAGFAVNPMQVLTRSAEFKGRTVEACFHTVRFAEQPIPGFRVYFCRHLTPEYVWSDDLMRHPNGVRGLRRIEARAADAQDVARRLALVADAQVVEVEDGGWDVLLLNNVRIHIAQDARAIVPQLLELVVECGDGRRRVLDMGLG